MDQIPRYEDGWQEVLDTLSAGAFFVTTGGVLIPEFSVQGFNSGESVPIGTNLHSLAIEMSLEWTYPLSHLTIVSGDGDRAYRDHFDLSATTEFDDKYIRIDASLQGRKWVRLEAWDIARNGAFTQPVWID